MAESNDPTTQTQEWLFERIKCREDFFLLFEHEGRFLLPGKFDFT